MTTTSGNILQGDAKQVLSEIEGESFDSCVTDPPYELGFMDRQWDDSGIAFDTELWKEVKRILKPGAHLLAFGGSRTHHRMMAAIEDAGFEIRDTLMWVYGGGFPKSMDVSKAIDKQSGAERPVVGKRKKTQSYGRGEEMKYGGGPDRNGVQDITEPATDEAEKWDGWGTALKPGYEPICLARKPLGENTVAENVLKHGTGALNIDDCRIDSKNTIETTNGQGFSEGKFMGNQGRGEGTLDGDKWKMSSEGRWPANLIIDDRASVLLDQQSGKSKSNIRKPTGGKILDPEEGWNENSMEDKTVRGHEDEGGASRFFYCPKAQKSERNIGAEENDHPTVKPIELMAYLIRLTTPPEGKTLDPFAGSGTAGLAAILEQKDFVLVEQSEEHVELIHNRVQYAENNKAKLREEIFEDPANQITEENSEVDHGFW